MGRLHDLYSQHRQSPWLDNLRRSWLTNGELNAWIDKGVRGLTSNPSIFAKAIIESSDYDDQLAELVDDGYETEAAYWDLVVSDITETVRLMKPVHEATDGEDGFVSVEVAPSLAHDAEATIKAAKNLRGRISGANLFIKVPATLAGLDAISALIAEGISVNVTLIFSLDRYEEVIEAYLKGLEAAEGDLNRISSVASFFVSRVDTEVDDRLEDLGTVEALELRGKAAVSQAQVAYQLFEKHFSGGRWEALEARGARKQRPLWASTSTKNPEYPDTLYVDSLIGPDTVNTLPDATLEAFLDHGTVERTIDAAPDHAYSVLSGLADVGVDLDDVAALLESQGVDSFAKAFDDVIETLAKRMAEMRQ